jgi:hypothetical protein
MYYRETIGGEELDQYINKASPPHLRKDLGLRHILTRKFKHIYPDAIFWWTESGWKEYVESGLRAWNSMVAGDEVEIEMCTELVGEIVYEDEHQILVRLE